MLVNAKYAEPLLTRRKITAAARAAFTFPMEDILEPETRGHCKSAPLEMLDTLNYSAAEAIGCWIASAPTNSATLLVRSLLST
jgi:hypothetical protein